MGVCVVVCSANVRRHKKKRPLCVPKRNVPFVFPKETSPLCSLCVPLEKFRGEAYSEFINVEIIETFEGYFFSFVKTVPVVREDFCPRNREIIQYGEVCYEKHYEFCIDNIVGSNGVQPFYADAGCRVRGGR